jgi:acyl carrier protein
MDDISTFISKIEAEIDGLMPGTLQPDTNYRQLPEWSSMHALMLIALSETEYNTTLTGEDLRKCSTVRDLYDLISSRQ